MRVEARLVPVRVADFKAAAERPKFCALANDKLRAAGVDMPPWQDAIRRYLAAAAARFPEARTANEPQSSQSAQRNDLCGLCGLCG